MISRPYFLPTAEIILIFYLCYKLYNVCNIRVVMTLLHVGKCFVLWAGKGVVCLRICRTFYLVCNVYSSFIKSEVLSDQTNPNGLLVLRFVRFETC